MDHGVRSLPIPQRLSAEPTEQLFRVGGSEDIVKGVAGSSLGEIQPAREEMQIVVTEDKPHGVATLIEPSKDRQ
jgi:hypothetical protein